MVPDSEWSCGEPDFLGRGRLFVSGSAIGVLDSHTPTIEIATRTPLVRPIP